MRGRLAYCTRWGWGAVGWGRGRPGNRTGRETGGGWGSGREELEKEMTMRADGRQLHWRRDGEGGCQGRGLGGR